MMFEGRYWLLKNHLDNYSTITLTLTRVNMAVELNSIKCPTLLLFIKKHLIV